MSVPDKNGPSPATDSILRSRRRHLLVLAGTMVAGLAVLFGLWLLWAWRAEDLGKRFPPGILADYVPEDSEAVLAVQVRQLLETPLGRQHLSSSLRQLIGQVKQRLPWLDLTKINPFDDLDTLLISFAPSSGRPLLLAHGRIDSSRFPIGPLSFQEKLLDHVRVWEYNDPSSKRTTLLAPVGDTFVVSETRSRVQAALKQANDPQPIHVQDARLREMLMKVARRQTLWLAASIENLGPVSEIDNYLLKMLLRPLFAHAESVYGGITCAEDLQAELHFRTATEEKAAQLETDLKSICEAALGIAMMGRQNDLLPLLRLLAAGQIHREGQTILLRCRLTSDQLGK
jgi:hypothetical protein